MTCRLILAGATLAAALSVAAAPAQPPVKIGLIAPLTGPFAPIGRQIVDGARLYLAQNGATAGGKTLALVVKNDGGVPDQSKRLAQELVVNDHVAILAGFGLTPIALAVGPVATAAKTPAVIMGAGTTAIVAGSPYFVRTSFTMTQTTVPMADWAARHGMKRVVTLVSDYGPGLDAEKAFKGGFEARRGKVVGELRAPLASPNFAPLLEKAKDLKPDALFLFVPNSQAATLMAEVVNRGLIASGIKLIGTGDVTDDDQLREMSDELAGMITAHDYSAAHDSPDNKAFVASFEKTYAGQRPNFMAVGGWDGMALIAKALDKTKGDADGAKLVAAMKGMAWMSPRGPISIDPQTRDIVQNVYIRRVEKKDGQLWNVEFETYPNVNPTHGEPKD